jgi:HipA-like kinase
MYVLKFRGAGQGPKALIAELVAGEIARAARLPIPEIVLIELDPELARTEPDPEIQQLIRASAGLNVALDYLPGAVMFDPLAARPAPRLASDIVWFDAFVTNVDRTARNANMLMWHRRLQLIDHGAALYFHHDWNRYLERALDPFTRVKDHILLPFAGELAEADTRMSGLITVPLLEEIVSLIPDSWLGGDAAFATPAENRAAYTKYLQHRLTQPHAFLQEAIRARSLLV